MNGARARTLALIAAAVTLVGLAWRSWYVCDDAYISFRYARNWADGLGLLYNVEDGPIEGYSNFVWVATATAARLVGLDEVRVMPGLSIGLAVVTVLVAAAWMRRLEPERPWMAVGVAWLLAVNAGFDNWATSGLETMQWTLTLLLGFLAWVYEAHPAARGLVLVVLAASRPEGVAWAPVLVVLGALRRPRSWSALGGAAVAGAVGIVGLQLARYVYFGDWVANTAHAKGGSNLVFYLRGLRYVVLAGWQTTLPVLAAPIAAWTLLKWRPGPRDVAAITPIQAAAAVALGHLALSVAVGGDYMPFARFLNSAMPFFAVLVVTGVASALRPGAAAAALATIALVSALPQLGVPLAPESARVALDFRNRSSSGMDERGIWNMEKTRAESWRRTGRLLRHALGPDEKIATVALGAIGYYSHRYVYDACYLVQRFPEGATIRSGERAPGHDSCLLKLEGDDLLAGRIVQSWGVVMLAEHAQAGDTWTDLLPDGVIRTYYRTATWLEDGRPGEFFYVDRHRAPWYPAQVAG